MCVHLAAGLPNLIFLDLYNNRIERVEGLQAVGGLRSVSIFALPPLNVQGATDGVVLLAGC